MRSSTKRPLKLNWERLSDEKLLDLRFCDLNLQISGSRIEKLITNLHQEIADKKLNFKPHLWIADEWFAADGVPGIAVPFYVLNKRLARLEKKMVLEVEGWREKECMKLLRHETGHAIDNAFRLRKSRKRQALFGLSSTPYPESYVPRAYSKKYVAHLNSWYAQAHPDEDWAETFSVWLNPNSDWKKKYAKWPALKKIKFVDQMMADLKGKDPKVKNTERPGDITKSKKKLRTFYKEKRKTMGLEEPFYFDPLLSKLFTTERNNKKYKKASQFIRQEQKIITIMVSRWTGQYRYTIDLIIKELIAACENKKLYLMRTEMETRLDLVGLLTAQALNYISMGKHKIKM